MSIFNQNFYQSSDNESRILESIRFWRRVVLRRSKFLLRRAFKNLVFGELFSIKLSRLAFPYFIGKHDSEEEFFGKKTVFEQYFWEHSDFGSVFLQRVRFWNKMCKRVRFRTNTSHLVKFWNKKIKNVSAYELKLFLEQQLWWEFEKKLEKRQILNHNF